MRKITVFLPAILILAVLTLSLRSWTDGKNSAQALALRALDDSTSNLQQLGTIHANTVELYNKLSTLYSALEKNMADFERLAARSNAPTQPST